MKEPGKKVLNYVMRNSSSKSVMEPLYAHTEGGNTDKGVPLHTRVCNHRYDANRCGLTYNRTVETIRGIKEVVYTNGPHSTVELTKDQKILLEKLSILNSVHFT